MSQLRPLNPIQLAFHYLGDLTNPNSGELLTFGGHLDVDQLRRAIELALACHPLLNAAVVSRAGRPHWQLAEEPLPVDLRINRTRRSKPETVLQALCDNLWREPLPKNGRQVRFIYTQGPKKSYLQICAPHSVTDAWSGTRLAADIGQAYTALINGQTWSGVVRQPLERPLKDVFLHRHSIRQRLGLMFEAARRLLRDVVEPGMGLDLDAAKITKPTAVSVTRVPNRILTQSLKQARHHGVTAHSLFLVALTRARRELLNGRGHLPFRVNDFATLRPFADRDVEKVFDVLVVPNQLTIDPTWDDDLALRVLSGRLKKQKTGAILPELYRLGLYGSLARVMPVKLTAGMVFKLINKTDLAVTNPGKVPWQSELERFGDVEVEDFINFPHLLPPAKAVVIFTTFRDELRIIHLHDPATTPEGLEKALIQPFIRHLDELNQKLVRTNQMLSSD
ncbi:MAG: hypothetical protein ACPGQS_04890 [Bradymonadia bacterium]